MMEVGREEGRRKGGREGKRERKERINQPVKFMTFFFKQLD